jgi:hypothetical protein
VAIEAARRGDFAAAGQALRSSAKAVAAEVDDDDDMKSQARRDILNQISLDKLSVDSDGGIVELYEAMKSSGLLSAYGSFGGFGQSSASKAISVQKLVEDAGVPLTALSPKRSNILLWQLASVAVVGTIIQISRRFGIDPGPPIVILGAGFAADQLLLRGAIAETFYGRFTADRICRHEAGHLVAGYLLGLSISGYSLSARESLLARLPKNVSSGGTMACKSFPSSCCPYPYIEAGNWFLTIRLGDVL